MNISRLNKVVTFQKCDLMTDSIGNHTNTWTDYYSCRATISVESGDEDRDAGTKNENVDLSVTVRWCSKTRDVTSTGYRLVIDGDLYDISGVDHFSYKNKALKFKCRKVRR